jgi:hypothetical protein
MSKKTLSSLPDFFYLYEDGEDEIKKQYKIDPINLYSYNKPINLIIFIKSKSNLI